MTQINYACPNCGKLVQDLPEISSGSNKVSCSACSWSGTENHLLAAAFSKSVGSENDLTQPLVNDLRSLLSKDIALPIAKYLARWGFLEQGGVTPYLLGRYIGAIANGMLSAIIRERLLIEQEKASGN